MGPTTQIYGQQICELLHRFGKSFLGRLAEQFQTQVVIGGSNLSERPSKKEYLFKGIIVLTIKPSCDRSALARIPRFVALLSVAVVASESRYRNWFFATLLEKSSEKSSRFLMKIPLWILSASYSFFPAELSFKLLINEKEPLIGADSVSAPMLAPFALASNLKSTSK